jgi:ankyrin repeat protein
VVCEYVTNIQVKDGTTPALFAMTMGQFRVTATLVSLDADANTHRMDRKWAQYHVDASHLDATEEGDWTPLMFAAWTARVEAAKRLLVLGH